MKLTAEEQAAIIDLARRHIARRARVDNTGATVTRNAWTLRQSKINGIRNDLRSVEVRLRNAIRSNNAEEETLARQGLATHRERLATLLEESDG